MILTAREWSAWRHGSWPLWSTWNRGVWGDQEITYRLFSGPEVSVFVVRLVRWEKVVYCQHIATALLMAYTEEQLRGQVMSFLKRPVVASGGGVLAGPFPDGKFSKAYPALYEYMTAFEYPDGTTRRVSSVTLFCEDCQLKACLSEKESATVLFACGKTLDGVLSALEGLLTAPDTPWRKSSGGVARKGGKGS